MKWDKYHLANKTSYLKRGISPKYAEVAGYTIINQKCIRDNRIDFAFAKVCDMQKTVPDEKVLRKGDILINSTGKGTLGRTAQIKNDLEDTLLVDTHITIVRAAEDVDPFFLGYLIRDNEVVIEAMGKGSTQQLELSRTDLGELELSFPPLPTQRKIASILSAYDDLIENNLKRIKLLEEKAKLFYRELMQEISTSKSKREELLKDCLAFYIGGGWGEAEYKERFTEPAYVIRGTDIPDVKKGEVAAVPYRYHKESNLTSRNMKAGDIVFEVSGGSKGQPVGRSLLITERLLKQFDNSVICASFCKMLRSNGNVTSEFFYLYLLASQENGVIAQYEKHSASNIVNYGFEEFIGEQKISIPKEADLLVFTDKVKPIFTMISTLGDQNSKLREARDILLPRLMSGQIEV
jgi:type I restriction enzyme S subunit